MLHVVLEGADEFFAGPRSSSGPLVDLLSLAQRSSNIGFTLVTDRPSEISPRILELVEILLAARTRGPEEQEPIRSWLKSRTSAETARRVLSTLPALEADEAWVCSAWLPAFQKVTLRHRATYDGFGARLNRLRPPQSRASAAQLQRLRERLTAASAGLPPFAVAAPTITKVPPAHSNASQRNAEAQRAGDDAREGMRRRGRPVERLVLTTQERASLERHAAGEDPQLALRAQIVLACAGGRLNSDVAREHGVSNAMIGKWRRRFVHERLRGLEMPLAAASLDPSTQE
jgi:hypothetical protein